MISIKLAVLLFLLFAIFEFFVLSALVVVGENKKRMDRMDALDGKVEEVIEAAIDHGYIEASRSDGDYDLNIYKEGTRKIREILRGML